MIKLHGQSSWMQAVMFDGARAKMQFHIAFDKVDPTGTFHGVDDLVFDMPRSDWTFMHDRLAHAWLRQTGIMASCAVNARLVINGEYYGLYVVEEDVGHGTLKQFFPDDAGRRSVECGRGGEDEQGAPEHRAPASVLECGRPGRGVRDRRSGRAR